MSNLKKYWPKCWRHLGKIFNMTSSNGNISRVTGPLCAGNSPVTGEFPAQRPVTRSSDVFFDLRLNKRLSKQSLGWWFPTPSRSIWRHCNECGACLCKSDGRLCGGIRRVSQMWALLAACREQAVDYNTKPKVLYISEHKTWYILNHVPYTRIVVFWHINNILPVIS